MSVGRSIAALSLHRTCVIRSTRRRLGNDSRNRRHRSGSVRLGGSIRRCRPIAHVACVAPHACCTHVKSDARRSLGTTAAGPPTPYCSKCSKPLAPDSPVVDQHVSRRALATDADALYRRKRCAPRLQMLQVVLVPVCLQELTEPLADSGVLVVDECDGRHLAARSASERASRLQTPRLHLEVRLGLVTRTCASAPPPARCRRRSRTSRPPLSQRCCECARWRRRAAREWQCARWRRRAPRKRDITARPPMDASGPRSTTTPARAARANFSSAPPGHWSANREEKRVCTQ